MPELEEEDGGEVVGGWDRQRQAIVVGVAAASPRDGGREGVKFGF